MTPDWLLLRRFVQDNSQEAFAALTARYLNLVYSVCLRELHDPDLAQDVTQVVFLLLARTAPRIRSRTALPSWLFRTARFASQNARTREQRRIYYEEKAAAAMFPPEAAENAGWSEIEPLLNQSLAALRERERECVLLRFFQGMSFAEAGTALGLSEEAVRKRVTRSLEKMRLFFVKNGVIVPAIVLPVLLTAHAAKAAPLGLAPAVAQSTAGIVAGHTTTAAVTGSHAYQLSEGVLKAMKIAQTKAVVSLATAAVVGVGAYLVTTHVLSLSHAPVTMSIVSNPGHVLRKIPGKTLTASQIAARCREAYSALRSYQGTTNVTTQGQSLDFPQLREYHTAAEIKFVHPGKISVTGQDSSGDALAYVSNGTETEETFLGNNNWKKVINLEGAVAGMTGIAFSAPTTIPGMLIGIKWGMPVPLTQKPDPTVREDQADGQLCYVLTARATYPSPSMVITQIVWIDEKTFRLRRTVSDRSVGPQTTQRNGKPDLIPASRLHLDQSFTNERINQPIPDSTFTLRAVQ